MNKWKKDNNWLWIAIVVILIVATIFTLGVFQQNKKELERKEHDQIDKKKRLSELKQKLEKIKAAIQDLEKKKKELEIRERKFFWPFVL